MKSLTQLLLLAALPILLAPTVSHATRYYVDLDAATHFPLPTQEDSDNGIYINYEIVSKPTGDKQNTSPSRFFFQANSEKEIAAKAQSFVGKKNEYTKVQKQLLCYFNKFGSWDKFNECIKAEGGDYDKMIEKSPVVNRESLSVSLTEIKNIDLWKELGSPTTICTMSSSSPYAAMPDCMTWIREHRQ